MNYIVSTKDKRKLIISDGDINNALVFEYSDDKSIIVSITKNGNKKEHLLNIQADEAKIAIIDYLIDHL